MKSAAFFWLVLLVVFLIAEAACPIHLVSIWFALGALVAVLFGFNLIASVVVQLVTSAFAILLAMRILHVHLHMRFRQWLALRVGGGHVRANYLHDISASVMLTTSEARMAVM